MLKVNKNITINGTSEINAQQVVYMSATIGTDGANSVSINKSITNQELYNANKIEVRKDMSDFELEVYAVQDEINNNVEVQA